MQLHPLFIGGASLLRCAAGMRNPAGITCVKSSSPAMNALLGSSRNGNETGNFFQCSKIVIF